MAKKFFSVEEANALLPHIQVLMERMFALRDEAMALRADVWPVLEKAVGNGGSRQTGELGQFSIELAFSFNPYAELPMVNQPMLSCRKCRNTL